jgi:NCS1 family nucleobase:cation symporter-1
MLGMGLPVPLLSLVGLAAILALQVSDPSAWMVQLGGTTYGAIALLKLAQSW